MAEFEDHNYPPRARMSAYSFFVQKLHADFKKKHPGENILFTEFSRKCSDTWKKMSDSEKRDFYQLEEEDKKCYESDMANYVPPEEPSSHSSDGCGD